MFLSHCTAQANLHTRASQPVNLQMETDPGSEILYSENQTMDRILTCHNTKPKSGSNCYSNKQQTSYCTYKLILENVPSNLLFSAVASLLSFSKSNNNKTN